MEPTTTAAPRPSAFDRIARTIALLALVVIFTVIFWIPMALVPTDFGGPFVLAVLTLFVVKLASRLYRLRQRIDELEQRLAQPPQK